MSQPVLPLWEIVPTYHPVARRFHAVFGPRADTDAVRVLAVLRDEEDAAHGSRQAALARQVLP